MNPLKRLLSLWQGPGRQTARPTHRPLHFEVLEDRLLLAANPLASFVAEVSPLTDQVPLELNVATNGAPAALAFHVQAEVGQPFDPAAVQIRNAAGNIVKPLLSQNNHSSTGDSLVVAELGPGIYTINVPAQGGASGRFRIDVCLPGDRNGDRMVSTSELATPQAAAVQSTFGLNSFTASIYKQLNVPSGGNVFDAALDANMNGKMDSFDATVAATNGKAGRVTVGLSGDTTDPVITGGVSPDTGRFSNDGVTNDPNAVISGNIADDSTIIEFQGSIDGGPEMDLLAELDQATGNFTISRARLEAIFGGPLLDTGGHTLSLSAVDQLSNVTPAAFVIPFEYDTIAPDTPVDFELDPSSDSAAIGDLLTNDNTPTFKADAETNSNVQLFLNGGSTPIGSAIVTSPVSVTTSPLDDGPNTITATATDVAGNQSSPTAGITVTVDTVAPQNLDFDLDPPATENDDFGNPQVPDGIVTFAGQSDEEAAVELTNGVTLMVDSDPDGSFEFTGVPLPFGPTPFTVTATDAAGNEISVTKTFSRQNDPPQLDMPLGTLNLLEDDPAVDLDLSTFFSDPDIPDGDSLTFSVFGGNTALATASTAGPTLSLEPQSDQNGTTIFTVRATDQAGEFVQDQLTVEVAAVNDDPSFDVIEELDPVSEVDVAAGTTKYLALDGFDVDALASITFSAEVTGGDLGIVTPTISNANRSLRFNIAPNADVSGGQMIFEMFEDLVGNVTDPIIDTAEAGGYDNNAFGRVVDDFVIQTNSAIGGPTQLDDQFNTQARHRGPGYVSMANQGDLIVKEGEIDEDIISADDTNSTSIFITLRPTPELDGNHSVFAFQVEGQALREEIGDVPVTNIDDPINPPVITSVEVFIDPINGLLALTATDGASGTAQVTITADDGEGGTAIKVINVNVAASTDNMAPFLDEIGPVTTTVDTDAVFPVTATDAEGDDFTIDVQKRATVNFDNAGSEHGVTEPGTGSFSHKGANFSGGEVFSLGNFGSEAEAGLGGFDKGVYDARGGAVVIFDTPQDIVNFFYVSGTFTINEGDIFNEFDIVIPAGTATAFDDGDDELGSVSTNAATMFNDPANVEMLDFGTPIKRLVFTGGLVDSFDFTPYTVSAAPTDAQGNAEVTLTPPTGFVGMLEVWVRVKPDNPLDTDTGSLIDTQIVMVDVTDP